MVMARASLNPIPIPKGVAITQAEHGFLVKGPKGEVNVKFVPGIGVSIDGDNVQLSFSTSIQNRAMLGLAVALFSNAIDGVTQGFKKVLTLRGIGYKVQKEGNNLNMMLGYTHPVIFPIPDGIEIELFDPKSRDDKDWIADITVKGVDKHQVGQVAANIRRFRPPEPYKGKGIRYKDEYVRRKLGKRAVGAE
jgi:large subunit ribosomal protein L6